MTGARRARIIFRLTFLVLAAVALVLTCRQGSSLLAVGVVFTVYVAAATLWVRGQYQQWVEAVQTGSEPERPWTFRYRYSLLGVATRPRHGRRAR